MYCLSNYLISQFSNAGNPKSSTIPKPDHKRRTWQGLTALRASLLRQGRFIEALRIHRCERMSLPHHRRISASRLFLQACSAPEVGGYVNALWLEAEARLLLADSFVDCVEPQEAEEELRRAEAVLDLYTCSLPIEDKPILAPYLRIRWKQLGMIPDDDEHLRVRHSTSLELLESMKATYSACQTGRTTERLISGSTRRCAITRRR